MVSARPAVRARSPAPGPAAAVTTPPARTRAWARGRFLAELGDHESPPKALWEAASQRWIADINHRIALLENMRDMIGSCVGCGCLSLGECHLLNPGDELNQLGPGPRRLMRD